MCDGDADGDGVAGDSDGDGDSDGVGVGDDRSLQASLRRAAAAKLGASVDSMMPSDDLAWSSAGSSKMAEALQEGRCAFVYTLSRLPVDARYSLLSVYMLQEGRGLHSYSDISTLHASIYGGGAAGRQVHIRTLHTLHTLRMC